LFDRTDHPSDHTPDLGYGSESLGCRARLGLARTHAHIHHSYTRTIISNRITNPYTSNSQSLADPFKENPWVLTSAWHCACLAVSGRTPCFYCFCLMLDTLLSRLIPLLQLTRLLVLFLRYHFCRLSFLAHFVCFTSRIPPDTLRTALLGHCTSGH